MKSSMKSTQKVNTKQTPTPKKTPTPKQTPKQLQNNPEVIKNINKYRKQLRQKAQNLKYQIDNSLPNIEKILDQRKKLQTATFIAKVLTKIFQFGIYLYEERREKKADNRVVRAAKITESVVDLAQMGVQIYQGAKLEKQLEPLLLAQQEFIQQKQEYEKVVKLVQKELKVSNLKARKILSKAYPDCFPRNDILIEYCQDEVDSFQRLVDAIESVYLTPFQGEYVLRSNFFRELNDGINILWHVRFIKQLFSKNSTSAKIRRNFMRVSGFLDLYLDILDNEIVQI